MNSKPVTVNTKYKISGFGSREQALTVSESPKEWGSKSKDAGTAQPFENLKIWQLDWTVHNKV